MICGALCRNPIWQSMKGKPISLGSKMFSGVDEAGVEIAALLYPGRCGDAPEVGLSTEVVKKLLSMLKTHGHTIFTDN